METWLLNIKAEMARIRSSDPPGRIRTTARRIAGMALQHYYQQPESDFLRLLQQAQSDEGIDLDTRNAISRLAARLDEHFQSASVDPLNDANMVVRFVQNRAHL